MQTQCARVSSIGKSHRGEHSVGAHGPGRTEEQQPGLLRVEEVGVHHAPVQNEVAYEYLVAGLVVNQ